MKTFLEFVNENTETDEGLIQFIKENTLDKLVEPKKIQKLDFRNETISMEALDSIGYQNKHIGSMTMGVHVSKTSMIKVINRWKDDKFTPKKYFAVYTSKKGLVAIGPADQIIDWINNK